MMKRARVAILMTIFVMIGVVMASDNVFAIDATTILKKTLLNGLSTCYSDTYMVKRTNNRTIYGDVSLDSLLTEKGRYEHNDTVLVPSKNLGNSLTQEVPGVSCKQLFEGYDKLVGGKIEGLFSLYNKGFNASELGYQEETAIETENRCLWISYEYVNNGRSITTKTNSVCFAVKKDGNILYGSDGFFTLDDRNVYYYKEETGDDEEETGDEGTLSFDPDNKFDYRLRVSDPSYNPYPPINDNIDDGIYCRNLGEPGNVKFTDLKECLRSGLTDKASVDTASGIGQQLNLTNITVVDGADGAGISVGSIWEKKSPPSSAARDALKYFSGKDTFANKDVMFNEKERYDILEYYLQDALKNNLNLGIDLNSCYDSVNDLGTDYGALNNGKWCKIVGYDGVSGSYNIVDTINYKKLKTVNFKEVLEELKKVKYNEIEGGVNGLDVEGNGGSNISKPSESTCMNSGAAGSLGWIVCPVLQWLSDAAENAYDDFVQPALNVQPSLFTDKTNSGENGVFQAWSIFQGIANTLFIILFLVVIFSQLTGVGIDNYGIKKILPKLIVAAILINLSYIICQVFIDLSNIVGNGIQALLDGIAPKIDGETIADGITYSVQNSGNATQITGLAILGILAVQIWAVIVVEGKAAIVLTLLVSALSIATAIFFLFILLAAREAAIVVLTAISPLAFACMMLPNTKKLFDKWWRLGRDLLLVYPICGLLVGGGNFVSNMLLVAGAGSEGFFSAFMAMIVGIVPIFFIPTVLKGALSAMGNIGAKISGIGKSVGGRLKGSAEKVGRNSQWYKASQEKQQYRNDMAAVNRAKATQTKLRGKLNKGKTLSAGQMDQLRRAEDTLVMQKKRDVENTSRKDATGFEARLAGVEAKAEAEQVSNAEAMLGYGRVGINGGAVSTDNPAVNTNDVESMSRYYVAALNRYKNAQDPSEKAGIMAEIKAAQNIMSKTDPGRSAIQNNLEAMVASGQTAGLSEAASHLMSNYGELYKSKNRGANALITDLATAQRDGSGEIATSSVDSMRSKLANGNYDAAGASKYDQNSLAGADEQALRRMANAVNVGRMSDKESQDIRDTANKTLDMYEQGKISLKPEVKDQIEKIAGRQAGNADDGSTSPTSDGGGGGSDGGSFEDGTPAGPAPVGPAPNIGGVDNNINNRDIDYVDDYSQAARTENGGYVGVRQVKANERYLDKDGVWHNYAESELQINHGAAGGNNVDYRDSVNLNPGTEGSEWDGANGGE